MDQQPGTPEQFIAGFDRPPEILLVDDEPNVLSSLRRMLRPAGYAVRAANSGDEALTLLAERPADLVISDMRMPGMNGATLLTEVRRRWPDSRRLLLTGYAEVASAIAAINEGGIHRYVSKPWNDEELLAIVRQSLEHAGLKREHDRLEALTREQNEALRELNATLEERVRQRTEELQIAHQEVSLSMEKLKKTFFTSVQIFSQLIELRAPTLSGHSRRVADVSRKVAVKMGFSNDLAQEVFLAALLHDIGKIGYPDDLFDKPPGRMSADELGLMRKHTINGAAALMSMPDMRGVADIIRAHHERWDGKGYPEGLAGDRIPAGARILALANDYDAAQIGLVSARRMTVEEAKANVIEGRGFRYDPAVVDAFAELTGRAPKTEPVARRLSGSDLEPGMVLTHDLYSPDGLLLLAVGYTLDALIVKQIREFEESYGKRLVVCVRPTAPAATEATS
ncbi:HD domain-containing phosphohydrolase [Uliginosibacterium paludis]|uniref:HD domain-containing phosphohydrolase n=1 Tax=Uliginosibacterium paludis TaxID=1615952 RepID=A0ABV2CN62_9RHOO